MATTALAFLACMLSTLAPCVLPLLPIVLGAAPVATGLLITGADKAIETVLVEASPTWLNELTTRF